MPLKVGQRVTVLPGVSACKDEDSLRISAKLARDMGRLDLANDGVTREQHVGKRGEIVQLGKNGPCTCPPGYEDAVLVDDQMVNGKQQGVCTMREWFFEHELELG